MWVTMGPMETRYVESRCVLSFLSFVLMAEWNFVIWTWLYVVVKLVFVRHADGQIIGTKILGKSSVSGISVRYPAYSSSGEFVSASLVGDEYVGAGAITFRVWTEGKRYDACSSGFRGHFRNVLRALCAR